METSSNSVDIVKEETLAEMQAYYCERVPEYDDWWWRRGRYDRGAEANARWFAEAAELYAALDNLQMGGDVLELASGTGIWTERLLARARTVTAVDGSREMIEANRLRVRSERVRYVQADLFAWEPEREYDGVCFCFWISHVPRERLDEFLRKVAASLVIGGKLFFADNRREPLALALDQELPIGDTQLTARRLQSGNLYRVVKNFYQPEQLRSHLAAAGLRVDVRETATHFIYGTGVKE